MFHSRSRALRRVLRTAAPLAAAFLVVPAARPASLLATPFVAAEQAVPRDQSVGRSRYITIAFEALPDRGLPGMTPTRGRLLPIDLFDGVTITAVFDRFDRNETGVTWIGTVAGQPGGTVTLVYDGGTLAGRISLPGQTFAIRPAPAGTTPAGAAPLHILAEINEAGFVPEAEPIPVELSAADMADATTVMTDTAEFIDILVVYTSLAATWAGGLGIGNLVNLAVSDTNTAFATSGVFTRARLVGLMQVPYTEVSSFSTNLSNLRSGLSGLQGVAAARDAFGADLVAMIVRPASPDACGIAYLMTTPSTAFATSGFSVTDAGCIAGQTFAHELGHNMGLRHDWYMDSGVTPFTYAHGYVNTIARFRTIMSYPNHCTALGFSCTRLVAFSNPSNVHLGQPMGVPAGTRANCVVGDPNDTGCDADERLALNNTAIFVANFRQEPPMRPPSILIHPTSRAVGRGQTTTLQVAASGTAPLAYQWYFGTSPNTAMPVAGATGASLTVAPGDGGIWAERMSYWVRVANSVGVADSSSAQVTLVAGGAAPGDYIHNGSFMNGIRGWASFGPARRAIRTTTGDGVLEFYRPRGLDAPLEWAAVGQETGFAAAAGEPLVVTVDLGNGSATPREISVIVADASLTDVQGCTFELEPHAPLRPFRVGAEPTTDWSSVGVYFEALTEGYDGGGYLVSRVSLTKASAGADVSVCEGMLLRASPRPSDARNARKASSVSTITTPRIR